MRDRKRRPIGARESILSGRYRAGIAGIVGAVVAFGVAELVHGLYSSVPSVFAALAQGVIEYTPGELVTRGIELLGQADIPVLIASMVIGALLVAASLANLSVRRPILALIGVGVLAAVGIAASLVQPFVAPFPTVITVAGSLALGTAVTEVLLRAAGLRAPKPPAAEGSDGAPSPVVRSREATSPGGMAVGRGGFLLLGGSAAVAGLAALGVGRLLSGQGEQVASAPRRLDFPESPSGEGKGGAQE